MVKNLHLNCIERSLPLYDTATSKIAHPQWLRITDNSGNTFQGGDQEWYPLAWQQRAGCGPTNGSNLLWYLSRVPGCEALCRHDGRCTPDSLLFVANRQSASRAAAIVVLLRI